MARTHTSNDRIVVVLMVSLVLLAGIWARCVWLQVIQAEALRSLAMRQYESVQTLLPKRGSIYDREGRLLALSVMAPSIYANPRQVKDVASTARRLATLLDLDEDEVKRRLMKNKGFVWIARQVDPALIPEIKKLRKQGVGIREEPTRKYPNGSMAGHVLGFVDVDQRGLEGLELAFDGVLHGQAGRRSTLRDARGHQLIGSWTTETEPIDGYDVVLTIDNVIQQAVEEALDWGMEKYHAKAGSVVVMDPHTGALLAMANRPTYDPNNPGAVPTEMRRNRAITDLFEPGSVFKVVTASALLEEGLVTPDEIFFCENGQYSAVGRYVLHDHRPHGELAFKDIIRLSSNIGTAKAAQRLTPELFFHYLEAFGFGKRTGIDLVGEENGITVPPSRWSKVSRYTMPIGHEVTATPLQLAVMISTVANGGRKVTPWLVERIQTSEGKVVRRFEPKPGERILRPETAKQMQKILTSVVESGTGRLANVQGLTVAGKTGTAQKIEPNGRYSHSRYVASFVGFGPVPDSRFAMVISMDEPRPVYFGGVVAAPMFKRVVEYLASYWQSDSVPANRLAGVTS